MNVLIYDGPGVTSLQKPLLKILKSMLKNYDVQFVTELILNTHPWEDSTALVVMPGGRDLQFLSALEPLGIQKLKRYVENGGSYLGLCAGAYFACRDIQFELHRPFYEVVGPRPLQFVPARAIGSVSPNFDYGTELGASAMRIVQQDGTSLHVYVNGGPCFRLEGDATVLARYESNDPAIVKTKVGKGNCIISGPHIEVSSSYLKSQIYEMSKNPEKEKDVARSKEIYPDLEKSEVLRDGLFSFILKELGLQVEKEHCDVEHQTYPIYISCLEENDAFFLKDQFESSCVIADGYQKIQDKETSWILVKEAKDAMFLPHSESGIVFYDNQELEKFNIGVYQKYRRQYGSDQPVLFGNVLMYTPMIGSTQTTIDNNHWFSSTIPSGSVLVASHQTAGRGRGKNSWISNAGCLQFSLCIDHSLVNSVIFLQYLFGLAVIDGIKKLNGCQGIPVHLKWPNDIYAKVDGELKKMGGILVTSEWFGDTGSFRVTIGCGLNVLNTRPSTCLQDLVKEPLEIEAVLAVILAEFEALYQELTSQENVIDVFGVFRERYYRHCNQAVQVQNENGIEDMRIRGLDPSGFLKAKSTKTGEIILLQPDGNTFDMLKGLISVKPQHIF